MLRNKGKIDEEALVKMLYGRNGAALGIIYDNYSAPLYGVILRIVKDPALAEEVLQETFSKIWNDYQQYDASKGRLLTWLINVSRNASMEKIHSGDFSASNKNLFAENYVSVLDYASAVSYNPEVTNIKNIIQQLEPEYRMIIDLLFFQGLNQFQAAETLNIPLGTVKSRVRAAIQKLQAIFQHETLD